MEPKDKGRVVIVNHEHQTNMHYVVYSPTQMVYIVNIVNIVNKVVAYKN